MNKKNKKFIVYGDLYDLEDAIADKDALEAKINDELDILFKGLVGFSITEVDNKKISFHLERPTMNLPVGGFMYATDSSLITGMDIDCFTPAGGKNMLVRAVPFDSQGFQNIVLEVESLFKREIETLGKCKVKKVKIHPGISTLDITITYK